MSHQDTSGASDLHEPVMLPEVLDLLAPVLDPPSTESVGQGSPARPDLAPATVVDATLGMGGHTESVLKRFPLAHVVGWDRDPDAVALAGRRLSRFGTRFRAVHTVFDAADPVLSTRPAGSDAQGRGAGIAAEFDGRPDRVGPPVAFLFDLGVSSMQIDSDDRGFAYSRDTPLDMRMDPTVGPSAEDVINDYDMQELARVFKEYGEERQSRRLASAVTRARSRRRIVTTGQLAEIVAAAIPAGPRRKGHPAKRVFQAIRIEVNDELAVLQRGLDLALGAVAVGGRVVVLSYHSLEDRITKRTFAAGIRPDVPAGLPFVPDALQPWLQPVTRGAVRPTDAESADNPRARSARLRAVTRIRATSEVAR